MLLVKMLMTTTKRRDGRDRRVSRDRAPCSSRRRSEPSWLEAGAGGCIAGRRFQGAKHRSALRGVARRTFSRGEGRRVRVANPRGSWRIDLGLLTCAVLTTMCGRLFFDEWAAGWGMTGQASGATKHFDLPCSARYS